MVKKVKSKREEEYFQKQEAELLNKLKQHKEKQKELETLENLKKLHYMHCPKCGQDLEERSLQEVKVDVCPKCEGIWLDRGELELLRKRVGFQISNLLKIFSSSEER